MEEAFSEEVALSSAWQGVGDRLGEGVSGWRASALPFPLPRVVELWRTQHTLAPDEARIPLEDGRSVKASGRSLGSQPPEGLMGTL